MRGVVDALHGGIGLTNCVGLTHQVMDVLCKDPVDHVPVHVGQAPLNAIVIERQSLVIDAQQVQYGSVKVVPMHSVLVRNHPQRRRHSA